MNSDKKLRLVSISDREADHLGKPTDVAFRVLTESMKRRVIDSWWQDRPGARLFRTGGRS